MPLWKIAWRSIQRRALASGLTALSMGLGVMLVVAVLLIHGVIAESFRSNASLGYNLIVGAKGGRLQLVLNTVFYLSQPVENIPYEFYQEFLSAEERGDGRDGKWKDYVQRVVPVCLGDYYQQYRVVGTTPKMFDNYVFNLDTGEKFEFAAGRNFHHFDPQHGFFEAVVGAKVAREAGLQVGAEIAATHGSSEGSLHDDRFHVVGILAPSGTPNDRAVFVNMEGFYLLQGHAKPVEGTAGDTAAPTEHAAGEPKTTPLPLAQREITAMLVSTRQILAPGLSNMINEGPVAQAVFPVGEIDALFRQIVQPFQRVLLALTAMICVVSGISILVSIYNSMSDRRREIAIMRSLGASRYTVMGVVLLEAIILALGGGLFGWLLGHGMIALASPLIEAETGVSIGLFDLAPPVNLLAYLTDDPIINLEFSAEWILVPGLMLLAVVVGFLPALAAYRTDVAEALSANP